MSKRYPVTDWDPNNAPVPSRNKDKLFPYDFHGVPVYHMQQIDLLVQKYKLHEILLMISPNFNLNDELFWINPYTGRLESFRDISVMESLRHSNR